jgi:RNA polymerase sigma-70 factor, ECF subfamily
MDGTVIDHPAVRAGKLLERARSGDHDAFGEIVRMHESMVYSIALHALRDRAAADELAQEVFLRLFRSLHQIESAPHLLHWLRRVATNRCIDAIRSRRDMVALDAVHETAAEVRDRDALLEERLQSAVSSLPEQQRLAIVLRYQEEMDAAEISEALGIPVNTIRSHLQRGLAALRKTLAPLTAGRTVRTHFSEISS